LAGGGDEADFFETKTSRLGYFAYRPDNDFVGHDSFSYSVRNETSGLLFQNTVQITIKPPPALILDKLEVDATRERSMNVRPRSLAARPNTPVSLRVPHHQDFVSPADRADIADPKGAYLIDEKAKPQNGTAKLDPATGLLTYAPNPGFIGEDRFTYYTVDENN